MTFISKAVHNKMCTDKQMTHISKSKMHIRIIPFHFFSFVGL